MPLRAVWAAVPMLAPGATSSVAFSAQLSAGSPFGRLGLPSTPRALVCVGGGGRRPPPGRGVIVWECVGGCGCFGGAKY